MSTKTIALETSVYERLAREKRESESFTKVIARLLAASAESRTGRSIAATLARITPLEESEADHMHAVVRENRTAEEWPTDDLR